MREIHKLVDTGVMEARLSPDGRLVALSIERRVDNLGGTPGPPFSWFLKPRFPGTTVFHEIRLRPIPTGPPIAVLEQPGNLTGHTLLDFLPDGRTLAVEYATRRGDRVSRSNPPTEWTVSLWDVPPRLHIPWEAALAVWFGLSAAAWSFSRLIAPTRPGPAPLL